MGGDRFQMSRFFVNIKSVDLDNNRITITGEDVRHIRSVLRSEPGDALELSDGSGADYEVTIERIEKDSIITNIVSARPNKTEPPVSITLFQGIPKADKMEYIIQKCVELGVNRIVPVMTTRTVVKLDNVRDAAAKTTRWKRIALEAAKQCDRGTVPVVEEPVRLGEALRLAEACELRLLPYEEETEGNLRQQLEKLKQQRQEQGQGQAQRQGQLKSVQDGTESCESGSANSIAVFIGPEGGFATAEVEKAVDSGFKSVSLGPRILRTETAGIAVITIIMYELGDMS